MKIHGFYSTVNTTNAPGDWGDKKCPCCGGNASSTRHVCSTCRRDAQYGGAFAERVRTVEARLAEEKKIAVAAIKADLVAAVS